MRQNILLLWCTLSVFWSYAAVADVKISQLPLGSASAVGVNDALPFADIGANATKRMKFSDMKNLPSLTSTYAPIAGPTFTGIVTASSASIARLSNLSSDGYIKTNSGNGSLSVKSITAAFQELYQNISTALGDLIYGGASGTPTRLAGNTTTTKKFLNQTGNGSISAAPSWDALVSADIPNNSANTTGSSANFTGSLVGDVVGTQGATVVATVGGSSAAAIASAAATTYGTGLTKTVNNVTVNGSQAIAYLSNLSSDGYVKTNNGIGGLSVKSITAAFQELYQNISTTLGDLIYGGASGTPTRLAGNTTANRKFLEQTGNGSISAAPSWVQLFAGTNITLSDSAGGTTINASSGGSVGSPTTFTPSWRGSTTDPILISPTVYVASYIKIGKMVHINITLNFGPTSTQNLVGTLYLDVPNGEVIDSTYNAIASTDTYFTGAPVGRFSGVYSGNTDYEGYVFPRSTTQLAFAYITPSSTNHALIASASFVWGDNTGFQSFNLSATYIVQ